MKLEKSSHDAYKLVYPAAAKYYRCCFCKKALDYNKEGNWYLDLDKHVVPTNSFYIFCDDTCLNCFILQGKP